MLPCINLSFCRISVELMRNVIITFLIKANLYHLRMNTFEIVGRRTHKLPHSKLLKLSDTCFNICYNLSYALIKNSKMSFQEETQILNMSNLNQHNISIRKELRNYNTFLLINSRPFVWPGTFYSTEVWNGKKLLLKM